MENIENFVTASKNLREEIRQEMSEINGLLELLNADLDELLQLIEPDGSLLQSVKTASEIYQELTAEFKKLKSIPQIGATKY